MFSTEETVGNYPWVTDYSTAKATSYVDGENKAATSWLISSPVDFTNETEAYVAFDYIIRYAESGKVAANHQLLISNNYAGNAAEATWVDLPYNAVEGSDWATFYKANVAVPAEFLGKSGIGNDANRQHHHIGMKRRMILQQYVYSISAFLKAFHRVTEREFNTVFSHFVMNQ